MKKYNKDLYQILGINFEATKEDVKVAYRKRAKKVHPDCGGSFHKFIELQEAYEILEDEIERENYNKWYVKTYMKSMEFEGIEEMFTVFTTFVYNVADNKTYRKEISVDVEKYQPDVYLSEGNYYGIQKEWVIEILPKKEWEIRKRQFEKKRRRKIFIKVFASVIAVILFCGGIYAMIFNEDHKQDNDEYVPYDSYKYSEQAFNYTEEDKPRHKETLFDYYDGYNMSIFKVNLAKDSTYSYYIKLVDPTTEQIVQAIFMEPATSAEFIVPCGEFKLKYAMGEKWYGYQNTFGPHGVYSESDDLLEFTQNYGQEVTLYPVYNGNLDTDKIDFENF